MTSCRITRKTRKSLSYHQVCDSSDCSFSAYQKKYLVVSYQSFKCSFEWSNNSYSFDVAMFYDLSFLPFSCWFQPPPSRFPILLIRFYSISNLLLVILTLLAPAKYVSVKFLNTLHSLFSDPGVIISNNLVIAWSFLAVFEKRVF